ERDRERERQLREREVADDDNFVPTLVKNQQRESLISSGGTGLGGGGLLAQGPLLVRTSNFPARSPPRDIPRLQQRGYVSGPGVKQDVESIADRFVLPSTSAYSSHGQGQGNRDSGSIDFETFFGSELDACVPALLSTAVSSSSCLASGLQDVAGLSRSRSSVMTRIVLPSQQQKDWVLSISVRRASSTVGGVSGGAGGPGTLGPIGVFASPVGDLHLLFLQKAKKREIYLSKPLFEP
ncbi:hypothetical protein K435DRAFT_879094, partial [Dendrothele bispora CBS 962.96]